MHCEIYKAVRAEVGETFPILIKLGVEDAFKNGLQFKEGKVAAQIIAACGYDALEISQGLQDMEMALKNRDFQGTLMRMKINTVEEEGYFRDWCREVKLSIAKPKIMTGGLRSYDLVNKIAQDGETDMIGMCRPFVKEPNLVHRWQQGGLRKANCTSCNKCVMAIIKGRVCH
jgi:2,4-dienoyl-CoA reductase-like NADH-dependent reductase (Old Yellow Enzyme family)